MFLGIGIKNRKKVEHFFFDRVFDKVRRNQNVQNISSNLRSQLDTLILIGRINQKRCVDIKWLCKQQTIVSLCTAEEEFIALSEAAKEVMWLRNILAEKGCEQFQPN